MDLHLLGVGGSDTGEDVLGDSLGLHVGVADARGQLRQRNQPHVQRQRLAAALHHIHHLAPRRPLLHHTP